MVKKQTVVKTVKAGSVKSSIHKRRNVKVKAGKNLKQAIKSEIVKYQNSGIKQYNDARTQYNNSASVVADLRQILPAIFQVGQTVSPGVLQKDDVESREGNKIRLTSIRVQGLIAIPSNDQPESADRGLIYCRLLCISCKKYSNLQAFRNEWDTGENIRNVLLKYGSSPVAFNGTMEHMYLPINSEMFTSHYDRKFYLNRGQRIQIGSSLNDGIGGLHMPNVYKPFSFSLKVHDKQLLYSNPADSQPSNFGPAVILLYSYANGAAASVAAVPFMNFTTTTRWKE